MKILKSNVMLFVLSLLSVNSAFSQYSCKYSINKETNVKGEKEVTMRDITQMYICDGELKGCSRRNFLKELKEDENFKEEILETIGFSKEIIDMNILNLSDIELVDLLFSDKLVKLKVNNNNKVNLGTNEYLKFIPINEQRSLGSYELYNSLGWDYRAKRIEKFRMSLGGGLTKDLSKILTTEVFGNYSYAYVGEVETGEFISPYIYPAIVGDQLVLTFQKKLGKNVEVKTFPIPLDKEISIPFSLKKNLNGFEVDFKSLYKISCKLN